MQAAQTHIVIRPASIGDLPELGQIWLELMALHEQEDDHFRLAPDALMRWMQMADDMIARDDAFLLNALLDGRPAGFCLGWVAHNPPIYATERVGFVSEVAVVRWAQRQGLGRELIRHARRWFAQQGLDEFQLSTAVWNEPARRFWESIGGAPLLVRYRFDTEA